VFQAHVAALRQQQDAAPSTPLAFEVQAHEFSEQLWRHWTRKVIHLVAHGTRPEAGRVTRGVNP
jgi:hypothetical protein